MSEILEKALMIGFGLIVSVVIFSLFSPILSILIRTDVINSFDQFVSSVEDGINIAKTNDENEIQFYGDLNESISMRTLKVNDHFNILINSCSQEAQLESTIPVNFHLCEIDHIFIMTISFFDTNNSIYIHFKRL
ncbi:MAG: hypothetical protein GF364_07780 [Candidatus Lokiarchaeota archaeon]|nr:hypothetical protein [Candidatus Lokiarchaeota archaeon]